MPHLKKSPANRRAEKTTSKAMTQTMQDLGKGGLRKSTRKLNRAASVAVKVSKVSTKLRRRSHKLPKGQDVFKQGFRRIP